MGQLPLVASLVGVLVALTTVPAGNLADPVDVGHPARTPPL